MGRKFSIFTKVVFNVAVILGGIGLLAYTVTGDTEIQSYVSDFLNDGGETIIHNSGEEPVRYKTWYSSVRDNFDGSGDVVKAAESEGAVLLKNDNNTLPLDSSSDGISLYGVTAYTPIYSLDGAGEIKINTSEQQFFYDEFEELGFDMNEDLASWYNGAGSAYWREDLTGIYGGTGGNNTNAAINGASWSDIPNDVNKESDGYNTAIFVTGRITNEGVDTVPGLNITSSNSYGTRDNDYFVLTDNEISMLEQLSSMRESGQIDNLIVLINTASFYTENIPDILDDYSVDAAMWIGLPGSHGVEAVCDLISGSVTPSGGLSDFWYSDYEYIPSSNSFGNQGSPANVVIQEDIYTSYKYAETRYADVVTGEANSGTYDYDETTSYPFGYGLSYASFEYSNVTIEESSETSSKNYYTRYEQEGDLTVQNSYEVDEEDRRKTGDDYTISVTVTNTSDDYTGKEIVQVYLNKPYTDENKEDGVQKSFLELVGIGKTSELAPGESETVEIEIDANKNFASYNDTVNNGDGTFGAYQVDEGTYYLTVARNSHQAANNILKAKRNDGEVDFEDEDLNTQYDASGDPTLVTDVEVGTSYTDTYEYWTKGGQTPYNQFDHANPNVASGDDDYVTFMDRANWEGTYDIDAYNFSNMDNSTFLIGDMDAGSNVEARDASAFSDTTAREYYSESIENLTEEDIVTDETREEGETTEVQLWEMIGVEYDPNRGATEEEIQKWEDFMDQLSWQEICDLVGNGRRMTYGIDSIGKPQTNDVNASNGMAWRYDMTLDSSSANGNIGFAARFATDSERDFYSAGMPCEGIIAATFNVDLAYAAGQAIGENALWNGASGLYGFGLGLHRSPYHGRTGEFYSDDPYLTGIIGGYETLGAQSKGLQVYNKHFVLNDQENSRSSYNTWLREQTFRETYLRSFEMAIEIGDAMNVMTAFNSIGSYWAGADYNLMTEVLRHEMGMAGFAVTDWYYSTGMTMTYGLLAGQDLPDGTDADNIYAAGNSYNYIKQAARRSAQRILYVVANSNAMNFIGEGTYIEYIEPNWLSYRDPLLITSICVLGVGTVLVILGIAFDKRKKQWYQK